MEVRLSEITNPVTADRQEAGDLLAYCAMVSTHANQTNT